jgi:hypothetical protein
MLSGTKLAESSCRSLFAALLVLGACGGGQSDPNQPAGTGGGAGSGATAGSSGGSSPTGGTGGGAGGATAGAGGSAAPGGAGAGGNGNGGSSTGGSSSAGTGGASTGGAGSGGNGGASSGGTGGTASAGRGGGGATIGPGRGGMGGTAGAGSGGSGGGPTACTRELLRSTITATFTALAAHSASTLPTAANVKFTENGVVRTLGQQGLWMTAGAVKYAQSALDVESCSSATHAVVPDGTMDIPVALRLKLQNQMITEIETIAVRPGDYKLGGTTYASNTAAMISANTTVMWEAVPSGQRNTRAELIAWIDKYFRMFPRGVCNTVSSCRRLENGGGSFVCTDGASCAAGQPTGTPAMTPRILLADPETGIGVGLTMFMGNTDMHMFKMYGGQVYAVHAVLGGATSSGWE